MKRANAHLSTYVNIACYKDLKNKIKIEKLHKKSISVALSKASRIIYLCETLSVFGIIKSLFIQNFEPNRFIFITTLIAIILQNCYTIYNANSHVCGIKKINI